MGYSIFSVQTSICLRVNFEFKFQTKMNQNNTKPESESALLLIPNFRLEAIEQAQAEILAILKENKQSETSGLNYVDEKRAIQLVGKKATWFWQMRKSGRLKFTKVGAKVFYSLDELKKLVSEGGTK